jgi:hypothetical protein
MSLFTAAGEAPPCACSGFWPHEANPNTKDMAISEKTIFLETDIKILLIIKY